MLKSSTTNLSKPCPFCFKAFKQLGIHLKHCSQRCGREYQTYLSQKKKAMCLQGKSKKKPCGRCGKLFKGLDNHHRGSSQCRVFHLTQTDERFSSQSPSSPVSPHISEEQGLPTITEFSQPELDSVLYPEASISEHHSLSLSLKDPFNCPQSQEEWQVADEQLTSTVTPHVFNSVDEKHQVLCSGVYEYFSVKYGTRSKTPRKKKRQKCSQQEKALIRVERNKARQQLRKAKRNSSDPETI